MINASKKILEIAVTHGLSEVAKQEPSANRQLKTGEWIEDASGLTDGVREMLRHELDTDVRVLLDYHHTVVFFGSRQITVPTPTALAERYRKLVMGA